MAQTACSNEWITRPRNRDQFQFIDERRIRPDIVTRFTFVAEAKIRWNEHNPLRADPHSLQSLLPTFHTPIAFGQKVFAPVELFAINEITAVFDNNEIVCAWLFASAFL